MIRNRWALPLIWSLVILSLTSIPNLQVSAPKNSDKVVHFLVYAVLGLLVARAKDVMPRQLARVAAVVIGVSLFGAMDEWHQGFIPGRFPDVRDWMADTVGGIAGATAFTLRPRQRLTS